MILLGLIVFVIIWELCLELVFIIYLLDQITALSFHLLPPSLEIQ